MHTKPLQPIPTKPTRTKELLLLLLAHLHEGHVRLRGVAQHRGHDVLGLQNLHLRLLGGPLRRLGPPRLLRRLLHLLRRRLLVVGGGGGFGRLMVWGSGPCAGGGEHHDKRHTTHTCTSPEHSPLTQTTHLDRRPLPLEELQRLLVGLRRHPQLRLAPLGLAAVRVRVGLEAEDLF